MNLQLRSKMDFIGLEGIEPFNKIIAGQFGKLHGLWLGLSCVGIHTV